jgi:hypothetical protein
MRCAEACEFCATSDLIEQDVKVMSSCEQMNRQCAAVCWTSVALMSRDNHFAKQFAICVQRFAMLAPKSVSTMMWTIANNVHKHVAAGLKNVKNG